jgi:hypothetical protein
VEENREMVFHCHGRYDDPGSLVVTEKDYQEWYFSTRDEGASAFRQTVEILFSSNPILFVGFGMRDEDLLRTLRLLSAADPDRKVARPLFALLGEREGEQNSIRHQQLYDRYGIYVLPYPDNPAASAIERGEALCAALRGIYHESQDLRKKWLDKPPFRATSEPPPLPGPCRPTATTWKPGALRLGNTEILGKARIFQELKHLEEEALKGAAMIVLLGAGGTGKSWYAQQLFERLAAKPRKGKDPMEGYDGFFFWSAYYANDALTGLDRLVQYLDPGNSEKSRLERLQSCL